jgi:hypothetical protein
MFGRNGIDNVELPPEVADHQSASVRRIDGAFTAFEMQRGRSRQSVQMRQAPIDEIRVQT